MAKQYIGVEALTIVKLASTGSRAYVYAGQPVSTDVSKEEIARLEREGFIAEVVVPDPEPEIVEVVAETPDDPASASNPDRPEPTGLKSEWVAYAVKVHKATDGQMGFTKDAAEDLTRAQLIEQLP